MECRNHPGVSAVARCAGCAEAFCANCLVQIGAKKYCGSCKTMAADGKAHLTEEASIPCKEAGEALTYAIIGIFCFGIILEPVALVKAFKAKKMIADNPRLSGSGKATAAIIIGFAGLGLWVLGVIARVSQLGQP